MVKVQEIVTELMGGNRDRNKHPLCCHPFPQHKAQHTDHMGISRGRSWVFRFLFCFQFLHFNQSNPSVNQLQPIVTESQVNGALADCRQTEHAFEEPAI